MRKKTLCVMKNILWMLFLLCMLPCRPANAADAGTVIYGFDREFPPFSFEDARGKPTGFEVELMRAIAAESGLTLTYRPMEWSKIQSEMSAGTIQVTSGMLQTRRRSLIFLFSSKPYYSAPLRIYTRKADYVRDIAKLRGRVIGVEENSFAAEVITKYPGLGSQPFADKTSGLRALNESQVSGYLGLGPNVDWLLAKLRYTDIVPAGEPLRRLDLWFALEYRSQALQKKLESGFAAVQKNGAYETLYRKWFVTELNPDERDALVAAAASGVAMSYAPYSKKPQGAAVLCRSGRYYSAGVIEQENNRLSISAVQAAAARAFASGELEIRAVAQVNAQGAVVVPPDLDLDFLAEFDRGILVALPPVNNETAESMLAELRPLPPVRHVSPMEED